MAEETYTRGPWHWGIHDYSAASLTGVNEEEEHVLSVSPCKGCLEANKRDAEAKIDWKWGRCTTPSIADAKLIETSPELAEALWDEITKVSDLPHDQHAIKCLCTFCIRERSINILKRVGRM